MSANIDQLVPTKSLIDLSTHSDNDFGLSEYDLCGLFDDLLLAEYADETIDGDIIRDGVIVPANTIQRAWRVGRVIVAGTGCKNVSPVTISFFHTTKEYRFPVSLLKVMENLSMVFS